MNFNCLTTVQRNSSTAFKFYDMYIPRYFTLSELTHSDTAIRLNIVNQPDFEHVYNLSRLCELVLDPIRAQIGIAIRVTSGFRSDELNRAIGGVSNSQHKKGLAADIVCNDMCALSTALANNAYIDQCIKETGASGFSWYHVSIPECGKTPRQQYFAVKNRNRKNE